MGLISPQNPRFQQNMSLAGQITAREVDEFSIDDAQTGWRDCLQFMTRTDIRPAG